MKSKPTFRFLLIFMVALGLVACDAAGEEEAAADSFSLAAGEPAAEAAQRVADQDDDDEPVLDACAFGQGYWKNHEEAWHVAELTLGDDSSYTQAELLDILNSAPRGDVTYILAQQLIAAELNLENGAEAVDAVEMAQAWLAAHPLGSDPEVEREEAIMLAETLDDYNNGLLAAVACDEIDDDEGEDLDDDDGVVIVDACTYSHGYWKNHADAWNVSELTLGDTTYSQEELLTILSSPPQGDATYILAQQLIAAQLNVENDAEMIAAIDDANLWLLDNPLGSNPESEARTEGVALAETLDAYNSGDLSAEACADLDDDDDDDVDLDEGRCTGADPHPHAQDLADRYDVTYDEIMDWFCEGYGFGEIEIAFNLSAETGMTVAEIMDMRAGGLGWGKVRKELGAEPGLGNGKPNPGNGGNPPGQNKDRDKSNPGNGGNPPGQDKDKDNRGRGNG